MRSLRSLSKPGLALLALAVLAIVAAPFLWRSAPGRSLPRAPRGIDSTFLRAVADSATASARASDARARADSTRRAAQAAAHASDSAARVERTRRARVVVGGDSAHGYTVTTPHTAAPVSIPTAVGQLLDAQAGRIQADSLTIDRLTTHVDALGRQINADSAAYLAARTVILHRLTLTADSLAVERQARRDETRCLKFFPCPTRTQALAVGAVGGAGAIVAGKALVNTIKHALKPTA